MRITCLRELAWHNRRCFWCLCCLWRSSCFWCSSCLWCRCLCCLWRSSCLWCRCLCCLWRHRCLKCVWRNSIKCPFRLSHMKRLPRKFADCVFLLINKCSFEPFMCLDLALDICLGNEQTVRSSGECIKIVHQQQITDVKRVCYTNRCLGRLG